MSGKQILDALEWGSRAVPGEIGGFLQVSGLTYEIRVNVESGCQSDENGMFAGIEGERRVANVMVNGEPLDPEKRIRPQASIIRCRITATDLRCSTAARC